MRDGIQSARVADAIPGPLAVLVALARGLWWLFCRVIGPALVILVVALALWHAGRAVLPRPRKYARRVHMVGRATLSGLFLAAAMFGAAPVALAVGTVVAGCAVAGAVVRRRAYLARQQAAGTRPPRRVRVRVGPPQRGRGPAGSPAIPAGPPVTAGYARPSAARAR